MLVWTGFVGLGCNAAFTVAVIAVRSLLDLSPALRGGPAVVAAVFVLIISMLEVPLTVFGLRKLDADPKCSRWLCGATNALYVFFAAVYGTVVLVLTGWWWVGVSLSALGLVRFASSVWLVGHRS